MRGYKNPRLGVQHASEVVAMDDHPTKVLRSKKDSSMRVCVNMVHEDRVQGCVSSGNTGALMATAKFVLKTLPHISRPAICTALPNLHGQLYALDLGANAEVSAEQLVEFAAMGKAVSQSLQDIESPAVGLLNIGEEEHKGVAKVQQANQLLKQLDDDGIINYQGYIEANDLFLSPMQVAVMGGSDGNIALKASEGAAKFIKTTLEQHIQSSWFYRLLAMLLLPLAYPFVKASQVVSQSQSA